MSPTNPPLVIVGVVGNVRQARLDAPPLPELYFPSGQAGGSLANMNLLVRTSGDPLQMTKAVVNAIHAIDPTQSVYGIQTMSAVVEGSVASSRLYLGLLATFAGIALTLAVAGIYGVMSYGVTQRTREFGIRLALGSDAARAQRLVVWEGTRLALGGLAIGLPAAFILTRMLSSVLYGVAPGDPATLLGVAAILATVSVAASYWPSRRIASVDPVVAMRDE
jgi:putative ABC transport system permease protein